MADEVIYSVRITEPGKDETPLGSVTSDSDDGALIYMGQLINSKQKKTAMHPDTVVRLVHPDGREVTEPTTVAEHLV